MIREICPRQNGAWDLNAVVHKNGTSAGDIGGKADDLKIAALSSNTTAGGSVLKVNFEGHSHLDGGSGGVAFVYVLNDDYSVTPTVVDISGSAAARTAISTNGTPAAAGPTSRRTQNTSG